MHLQGHILCQGKILNFHQHPFVQELGRGVAER